MNASVKSYCKILLEQRELWDVEQGTKRPIVMRIVWRI
jgi:hypothetical protein